MKKYIAAAVALCLILTASGCASLGTVDIDSENQAYSRVLYVDDESEEETDEEEPFEDPLDEKNNSHKAEAENKDKKKNESKKSDSEKKKESSSSKSSAASSKLTSSKAASSAARASSSESKSVSSRSENSSSKLASSAASSKLASSSALRTRKPTASGVFTKRDLSYNAPKDYVDFGDDERFVRSVMKAPKKLLVSDDETEEKLIYSDCTMTFKLDEENGSYYLVNIFVPFGSEYKTFAGVETEMKASKVIAAYGEPTRIEYFSDSVSTDTDTDTDSGKIAYNEETFDEPEYGEDDEFYYYTIDDKSLVIVNRSGLVYAMEYIWEQTD